MLVISLDIFVSDTSVARNIHLPQVHKDPYSLFGSDFSICVAQTSLERLSEDQRQVGFYHRGKTISIFINDWENNIAYWEESKKSKIFGWQMRFVSYCIQLVDLGASNSVTGKCQNLFLYVWKQYFQLLNLHKIVTYVIR